MKILNRIHRLWQLSATEPATHQDIEQLKAYFDSLHGVEAQKLDKITEWIGVLLKSELLRRERESEPVPVARRRLRD